MSLGIGASPSLLQAEDGVGVESGDLTDERELLVPPNRVRGGEGEVTVQKRKQENQQLSADTI